MDDKFTKNPRSYGGVSTGTAPKFRRSSYHSAAGAAGSAAAAGAQELQAAKFTSESKFCSGVETDPQRIEARLKQIQYGKNTVGYDNYLAAVPK